MTPAGAATDHLLPRTREMSSRGKPKASYLSAPAENQERKLFSKRRKVPFLLPLKKRRNRRIICRKLVPANFPLLGLAGLSLVSSFSLANMEAGGNLVRREGTAGGSTSQQALMIGSDPEGRRKRADEDELRALAQSDISADIARAEALLAKDLGEGGASSSSSGSGTSGSQVSTNLGEKAPLSFGEGGNYDEASTVVSSRERAGGLSSRGELKRPGSSSREITQKPSSSEESIVKPPQEEVKETQQRNTMLTALSPETSSERKAETNSEEEDATKSSEKLLQNPRGVPPELEALRLEELFDRQMQEVEYADVPPAAAVEISAGGVPQMGTEEHFVELSLRLGLSWV